MFEELTVTEYATTLDMLLTRRFKQLVPELLERVLAENRGLSAHGLFLPLGLKIRVPIQEEKVSILKPIRLWG
jgi:phage tail protein X